MENQKVSPQKTVIVSLIVIFLSLVIVVASCGGGDNEPKPEHDATMASIMAEEFVKKQLKSPGSAEFQSFTQQQIEDLDEGRYKVKAWVDSQNGFGALIRTNYMCIVKYTGNDNWQCENLEFLE